MSGEVPLRVLAASDFYLPRAGGVERVVHETARRLGGLGVAVEVLTRALERGAARQETIDGVAVWRVGCGPTHLPGEILTLRRATRRWARQALGRFDLVHVHLTLTGLALLGPARRLGLPVVATYYGPWHREYLEELSRPEVGSRWPPVLRPLARPFVAGLLRALQRRVLLAADRVLVLSEYSASELARLRLAPGARVERVPGGVDVERFLPRDREAARARFPALGDAGRPLLVAVRRLVPRMGLDVLLDAVGRLRSSYPDLTAAVGGEGPLFETLAAEARRRGLERAFRLLGRVPEEDLPWLYAAADLAVMPTRALEGFGLPVLEAWASGTPVVATRVGALEELVGRMGREWLQAGEGPGALAEALARGLALASPAVRERSVELARSHRWESVVARLAGVYRNVAAGVRPE